ncbi:MAG: glycosyltransferase family 1 protein [Methylophilaceae bacterium]|nr:glycosyltransferase family 1 protein [Methylophilaceae bacterium]
MSSKFYVLSLRSERRSPAYACIVEYEDVLVKSLGGALIEPKQLDRLKAINQSSNTPAFLFVTGIAMGDVIESMQYAKQYLDAFDGIYAYVFDSIIMQHEFDTPAWRKSLSSFYKLSKKITRLFIPAGFSVKEFEQCYQIPVSYMPMAADVLKHGDASPTKAIDVMGYGRQDPKCSDLLSEAFNQPHTNKIYYHTDHFNIPTINDTYTHRRFFWQLLRASKIALAFDALAANNNNRFRFSFVGQRWFESTAAGCVIVGKRPTCPEMDILFPQTQSTIDIPDEQSQIIPFFEGLLNEPAMLTKIGRDNYEYALEKNNWRHRVADMLNIAKIAHPTALNDELRALKEIRASQLIS